MEHGKTEGRLAIKQRLLARLSLTAASSSERVDGIVYGLEAPSVMLDYPDPADLMDRTARLLDKAAGLTPED